MVLLMEWLHFLSIIGLVLGIVVGLIWLVVNVVRKKGKKLPIAVMAISFVLLILASPSSYVIRAIVHIDAERALSVHLPNPESAEWISTEIIDDSKSNDGRSHHYLVLIEVEHESDTGDVVHQTYLVWVRRFPRNEHRIIKEIKALIPGWGYMFSTTDPVLGIREVSNPPTQEEIADIKKLVRWPEE